ncbi:hypothetical protein LK837_004943 [Salmonella enterica]|nr:hypothetical protein [Salmonella enterica]EIF9752696.1 hypothetical protein [Salmonella enterica]EIL0917528.1 hypothetical protein [Salmonella enterica]
MSMTKIRKNAFTKIQAILGTSVGVISRSSVSRIDDGHDDEYALSSAEEAIMWLKCHQDRAQVYIEHEGEHQVLRISGQYSFEPAYMAYFDKAYFERELNWFLDRMDTSEPAPILPPNGNPHLYLVQ